MQFRKLILMSLMSVFAYVPVSYSASYGKRLCDVEGFHCIKVRGGQTWNSLFPDAHDRGIVMRINRMNTSLWSGIVLAVPDDLSSSDIMDFSPFPKRIQPRGEKLIAVDPIQVAWGAYDAKGNLLRWGPVSVGRDWCNDIDEACRTKTGKFRVYSLGSSDCYSTKFPLPDGGAPMPYCMYFNSGQALHGEPSGLPGYNDSHGCVRMYVSDAEWLRYNFIEGPNANNGFKGTRVLVGKYDTPIDNEDDNESMNS